MGRKCWNKKTESKGARIEQSYVSSEEALLVDDSCFFSYLHEELLLFYWREVTQCSSKWECSFWGNPTPHSVQKGYALCLSGVNGKTYFIWAMKKRAPGCLGDLLGTKSYPQLYGDYFINHDIRIPFLTNHLAHLAICITPAAIEQWKKGPWLVRWYRGWNTIQLYKDYLISHYKL